MDLSSDFTQSIPDPPPLLIGALLRIPFETVRERMLTGLHERGFTDLVAAHLDVFQYPGPEGQRPLELATHTRMTKQALNYLLGQLQQLGYLTRETDDSDQRSKRIRLTPKGHAAIKAIREIVQDVENEWEQQLGPRNFEQLRDLLTQLHTITTGPKPPDTPGRHQHQATPPAAQRPPAVPSSRPAGRSKPRKARPRSKRQSA